MRRKPLALICLVLTLLAGAGSAYADATVTNNTPQDLAAALAQGGLVGFAQDGTITFTNTLLVTNQVQLDATGHTITLNGNHAVQLFHVSGSGNLALTGLNLTGGRSTNGGALFVEAGATAALTNCLLAGNSAGSAFTNISNVAQTNSTLVASNMALVGLSTNFTTNFFVLDPTFTFNMTINFVGIQTTLQTNATFNVGIQTPTNSANVGKVSVSTNQMVFTNVVTSTNFTLVTNAFGTIVGTNFLANTRIFIETDTSFITNTGIPMVHTVAAPGSDGAAGADKSFGRGGSGGNGKPGTTGQGGALCNRGTLSLVNCILLTNTATGGNGGNGGDGGNSPERGGNGGTGAKGGSAFGGAVYNDKRAHLFVQNCTFDHNTAQSGSGGTGGVGGSGVFPGLAANGGGAGFAYGGAFYNLGRVTLLASTFSDNAALGGDSTAGGTSPNGNGNSGPRGGDAFGGALYTAGSSTSTGVNFVTNCTFFGNAVAGGTGGDGGSGDSHAGRGGSGGTGAGGGLFNATKATTWLVNCTFWQNSAEGGTNGVAGSGVFANSDGSPGASHGGNLAKGGGSLNIANSIIGAATAGRDAYGLSSSSDKGFNIASDKSMSLFKKSHSTNGVNPGLGSFGAFGGPTMTISLVSTSLAIGFVQTNTVPFDQRGVPRPQGTNGFSDAGAVEETLAPFLMALPQSQLQTNGGLVLFSVSVAGTDLKYQWRWWGTNVPGATGATFTLNNVTSANEGCYDVVVTNRYGLTNAPVVTLSVSNIPPELALQPTSRLAASGGMVGFAVTAFGSLPLSYQWYFNDTNPLSGATSPLLVLTNVSAANVGSYSVVVTNLFGSVTSTNAVLGLADLPTISAQPVSLMVPVGSNATFHVTAQGTAPLLYQWQMNGFNLPDVSGTNLDTLTIPITQVSDAGTYSVLISNPYGSITSAPATLTVLTAPVITGQPASVSVLVGSNVTFQVAANGPQPLSYQWRFNQTNLLEGDSSTYVLYNAQTTNSGSYDVVITDHNGLTTNSATAVLTVLTPVMLTGRLTDAVTDAGLGGVTVLLTNQTAVLSTNTDAAGYYVFTNLWPGSNYTVLPVQACQLFQPAFSNVVLATAGTSTVDFAGITNNLFAIQGQITNGLTGISGVSVQLTNANGSQTLTNDAGGYYAFSRLCPGTYQVRPLAPGYQFVPASLTVSVGPNANQVNFAAIPLFTITGRIVEEASGAGLAGVTVRVNTTNSVQTDANGFFSQSDVPAGNYTLTPVLGCYRFTPSAALLSVGATGLNQTNFLATGDVYRLGGQVTLGTNVLNGLTLKLVGPTLTNWVTTSNGLYTFAGLCPGAYSIEPQPLGAFQFSPAHIDVNAGPDNTNLDFVVYGGFTASGHITLQATNPVPGVTVTATGTNGTSVATTDTEGAFQFLALGPGTLDITPSLAGYQFTPSSLQVTLSADTNGLDFAAVPLLNVSSIAGAPAQVSFPVLPKLTYTVSASSNFLNWLPIFTTNVEAANLASSVVFWDTGSTQAPVRYYRLGEGSTVPTNSPAAHAAPALAR